jgi:beta-glucosidase
VAWFGYQEGLFAPGRRDAGARERATDNFVTAHRSAVEIVRAARSDLPVGLTVAMRDYQAADGGEERMVLERARSEDVFLEATSGDDFMGVQTYTRERIGPQGPIETKEGMERTLMGYEFYPEALEATVRRAADVTGLPVIVTENGVAVTDDYRRVVFVTRGLEGLGRCLDDGVDVRGYFYWSAFDNFEWAFGYRPTFGLIAVDRTTQERHPKPSAAWLGRVASSGILDD